MYYLQRGLQHVSQLFGELDVVLCSWAVCLSGHWVGYTHTQQIRLEADSLSDGTQNKQENYNCSSTLTKYKKNEQAWLL